MLERFRLEIAVRTAEPFSAPHLRAAGKLALRKTGELRDDPALNQIVTTGHIYDVGGALRSHPQDQQQAFLQRFLRGAGIPRRQDLAKYLAGANHPDFFLQDSPTQEADRQLLQALVDRHLRGLMLQPLLVKPIANDWETVRETRLSAEENKSPLNNARQVARDALKKAEFDAFWKEYPMIDRKITGPAGVVAALARACRGNELAARWIVVQGLMPSRRYTNGNPFLPLTEICKNGYMPIGQVGEEFVVYPMKQIKQTV